jgi:hypothetical protein
VGGGQSGGVYLACIASDICQATGIIMTQPLTRSQKSSRRDYKHSSPKDAQIANNCGVIVSVIEIDEDNDHASIDAEFGNLLQGVTKALALDQQAFEMLQAVARQRCDQNELTFSKFENCHDNGLNLAHYELVVAGPKLVASDLFDQRLEDVTPGLSKNAQLVAVLDNASSHAVLGPLLEGDATLAGPGRSLLRNKECLPTTFKSLLDQDWLPWLAGGAACSTDETPKLPPAKSVTTGLLRPMRRIYIGAKRFRDETPRTKGRANFTIVVPTTNEPQLQANVISSPGIAEVQARVIAVRGAPTPASALEQAREYIDTPWILFIHQDVYLPSGFGERINTVLEGIPQEDVRKTLIGFSGLGVDRKTMETLPAGLVIDRVNLFEHSTSDTTLSIDELAVILHRDSLLTIDPSLGWHLWATDLCLRSVKDLKVFPRIINVPLYHNSASGWMLPFEFYMSAKTLLSKHPDFETISTLCGAINSEFVWRGLNGN